MLGSVCCVCVCVCQREKELGQKCRNLPLNRINLGAAVAQRVEQVD